KNRVWVFLADASYQKFPEGDRLGVRIVYPKDAHPALSPKQDDALHLRPELSPVFAAEIQWVNIFVLLRRILRILDRAIGSFVEPIRVNLDIRMIGRAIDRKIERNFHSARPHFFLKPVEVLQCAERRLHRLVSASLAADCPWHAGVARLTGDRV